MIIKMFNKNEQKVGAEPAVRYIAINVDKQRTIQKRRHTTTYPVTHTCLCAYACAPHTHGCVLFARGQGWCTHVRPNIIITRASGVRRAVTSLNKMAANFIYTLCLLGNITRKWGFEQGGETLNKTLFITLTSYEKIVQFSKELLI